MRKKIVAGNWKMNLLNAEANQLFDQIADNISAEDAPVVMVFPPAVFIHQLTAKGNSKIKIGLQNFYPKDKGAFTGEISITQVKDSGATHVLIGHSERRAYFTESNTFLKNKVDVALEYGVGVIFCCGEPLMIREMNQEMTFVRLQLDESLFHLSAAEIQKCVIAYEPVWAIGTGKTASVAQAEEMHHAIRSWLTEKYGKEVAESISILYGGSCNAANAKELFACPNVDGGLIGGAALEAETFTQIIHSFNGLSRTDNISFSAKSMGGILTAELAELGFESFVETENGVQAYGAVKNIDLDNVVKNSLLSIERDDVKVHYEEKIIPHQNWNAQWESDFHPVEVEDFLTIVAPFHSKADRKGMLVEIQPQMSFGTGHHQTTWLMSKALFELEQMPSTVLDMGTGTGVLAIVAEKLGAESILAIDIEDWSVVNAIENTERNHCTKIESLCGDVELIQGKKFGLIIANINKNVLKSQMESYSNSLEKKGVLLLSGFFDSDVEELVTFATSFSFKLNKVYSKETWAALRLVKQ